MPEVTEDGRTITKCGTCEQTDNAPKLQVNVGPGELAGAVVYHPHDFDRDGQVYYHFDCESPWHAAMVEVAPEHAAIVDVCKSGVQNDDLFAHILTTTPVAGSGL